MSARNDQVYSFDSDSPQQISVEPSTPAPPRKICPTCKGKGTVIKK